MAEYLARQGQLELLIETPRDRGEWFCAEVAVSELCAVGAFERALTVLELLAQGAERALGGMADCRCSAAGGQGECRHQPSEVLALYSRVLERMGRADEAIRLLGPVLPVVPRIAWRYADLLAGQGRIDRLRELATGEHVEPAPYEHAPRS